MPPGEYTGGQGEQGRLYPADYAFSRLASGIEAKYRPNGEERLPFELSGRYGSTIVGSALLDIDNFPDSDFVSVMADLVVGAYVDFPSHPFIVSPIDDGLVLIDKAGELVTVHGYKLDSYQEQNSDARRKYVSSFLYSRVLTGLRKGMNFTFQQNHIQLPNLVTGEVPQLDPRRTPDPDVLDAYRRDQIPALTRFHRGVLGILKPDQRAKLDYLVDSGKKTELEALTVVALSLINEEHDLQVDSWLKYAIRETFFMNPEGTRFIFNPWNADPFGGVLLNGLDNDIVSLEGVKIEKVDHLNKGLSTTEIVEFDHLRFMTGQYRGMTLPGSKVKYFHLRQGDLADDVVFWENPVSY